MCLVWLRVGRITWFLYINTLRRLSVTTRGNLLNRIQTMAWCDSMARVFMPRYASWIFLTSSSVNLCRYQCFQYFFLLYGYDVESFSLVFLENCESYSSLGIFLCTPSEVYGCADLVGHAVVWSISIQILLNIICFGRNNNLLCTFNNMLSENFLWLNNAHLNADSHSDQWKFYCDGSADSVMETQENIF